MANVFDYLKWRGDISFEADPVRIEDLLVLSQIIYWPFENLKEIKYKNKTLLELKKDIYVCKGPENNWGWRINLFKLWKNIERYPRFANLKLYSFQSDLEEENEKQKQFAAGLFYYKDVAIVAFRGTDLTLTGWKEDFNMAFETAIPGQLDAVNFLNSVPLSFKKVYICGHSKGGNQAMYSAVNVSNVKRIVQVANFDGPGLDLDNIIGKKAEQVKIKLHTYIPQSSIVAMTFGNIFDTTVIMSDGVGVLQHDVFSWYFDGPKLKQAKKLSTTSKVVNRTIHDFIDDTTPEKRKVFVMAMYKLIDSTGAKRADELLKAMVTHVPEIIKTGKGFSNDEKEVLKELRKQVIKNISQAIMEQKNTKGLRELLRLDTK